MRESVACFSSIQEIEGECSLFKGGKARCCFCFVCDKIRLEYELPIVETGFSRLCMY